MNAPLSMRAHDRMAKELAALRAFCDRTGRSTDDLREMIDIPPAIRRRLEDFCLFDPAAATAVRANIRYRDDMLDLLEHQEMLHARRAA